MVYVNEFGMGDTAMGDMAQRLLALRAVVAEAILSKAPRRTVACLGAAVATALFGAAAPGPSSARASARVSDEEVPAPAKRRPRRGKRAGGTKVVAEMGNTYKDAVQTAHWDYIHTPNVVTHEHSFIGEPYVQTEVVSNINPVIALAKDAPTAAQAALEPVLEEEALKTIPLSTYDVPHPSRVEVGEENGVISLPAASTSASSSTLVEFDNYTEPSADEELERFEPSNWYQFPYFGVRVAMQEGSALNFGKLTEVWRTSKSRIIIYLLTYDDGCIQHLSSEAAAEAQARAQRHEERLAKQLAAPQVPTAPRILARHQADAHITPTKGFKKGFLL
jgi:hypothetical protein